MKLVLLFLLILSIATLFTSSTKGRLLNSTINFFLMSLLAIKDYGTGLTWLWVLFLILAIIDAVFVVIHLKMYIDEKNGKEAIKINNRDKFLSDIKRKYGS